MELPSRGGWGKYFQGSPCNLEIFSYFCTRLQESEKKVKTNKYCVLLLAACMLVFASCKDDDVMDNPDYRDAWVGTYVGDSEYHFSANGGQNTVDTLYSNDSLSVAKSGDNDLIIDYRSQSFLVNCTAEGSFSRDNYPHGGCEGRCFGDSLYFKSADSEQGRTVTYIFKGSKIKIL